MEERIAQTTRNTQGNESVVGHPHAKDSVFFTLFQNYELYILLEVLEYSLTFFSSPQMCKITIATILFPQKLLDDPPTTFFRDSIADSVRDSVRITDLTQLLDKLFTHKEQLFSQKVNQLLDIDSCPTSIVGRILLSNN